MLYSASYITFEIIQKFPPKDESMQHLLTQVIHVTIKVDYTKTIPISLDGISRVFKNGFQAIKPTSS